MKYLKKSAALLLALIMILALSAPALAAEGDPTYSITINNAVNGDTYTAYKLFEVTVSADNSAYSYYIKSENATLKTALEGIGLSFTESADGTEFLVNTEKVNTGTDASPVYEVKFYKDTTTDGTTTRTHVTAAELAAAINTDLKSTSSRLANSVLPTNDNWKATAANGTATITVSSAGYYFVDSSLGSLCSLGTAANTVEVYEKNTAPTITKEVASDLIDTTYQGYGDGDVIDTINYKLTVNTGTKNTTVTPDGTGVDNDYVIEDVFPLGFTPVIATDQTNSTITVTTKTGTNGVDETWDATNNYDVLWTANTDTSATNAGTLKITLKGTGKLNTLAQNTDITITYKATMDSTVTIDPAGDATGNTNTATLYYQAKDDNTKIERDSDTAIVYTYQIGGTKTGTGDTTIPVIQKVDAGTKQENGSYTRALNGVKFVL